jgi:hypothetical protein
MTVYWVRAESNSAFSAMEAVERALSVGDTGTPPIPLEADLEPKLSTADPYLEENLALANTTWSVDPNWIVTSRRLALSAVLNGFQRLMRRVTWWYLAPQWLQANEFHGAVVRVLDSLFNRQRQDRDRMMEIEALAGQVPLLMHRLEVMQLEQRRLRRRIAALEALLADQANSRVGHEAEARKE